MIVFFPLHKITKYQRKRYDRSDRFYCFKKIKNRERRVGLRFDRIHENLNYPKRFTDNIEKKIKDDCFFYQNNRLGAAAVSLGAIHSTKIPTGPTGKIGPPQKVFSKPFRLDRTDPLRFGRAYGKAGIRNPEPEPEPEPETEPEPEPKPEPEPEPKK